MASYRESYIFHIKTTDPATFWTGHGNLLLPGDLVLINTTIAMGGGTIINIPDLEQLINGKAQRVEIVVSGVNEATLVFAEEEALQIPGAEVFIGRVSFDEDWQISGPVAWEWTGRGQSLTVSSEESDTGRTRRINLRVGSGDTVRSRAPIAYFTDADQRRDYPTDAFFSHVGKINAGVTRRWGPND